MSKKKTMTKMRTETVRFRYMWNLGSIVLGIGGGGILFILSLFVFV